MRTGTVRNNEGVRCHTRHFGEQVAFEIPGTQEQQSTHIRAAPVQALLREAGMRRMTHR